MILLVSSSLLALLAAEAAARWFFPYPIIGRDPHLRQEISIPGRAPAIYTTNSLGLRGDEPPPKGSGQQTILAVGGSTTHCWFLDDDDTWPARLQQDLRSAGADVWVGNGGIEGHSTVAHLDFVREIVARVRPGTVVFLVGINDLVRSFQRGATQGRTFVEELGARRMLTTPSRLLQLLAVQLRRLRVPPAQIVYRPWFNDRPLTGSSRPRLFAERAQRGLPGYLDNLKQLASRVGALGARPIFLTQPILYENTARWLEREAPIRFMNGQLRISAAQTARLLGGYNRALLDLCRREKLECFDLAGHVPHDPQYFYDWVHFNKSGAALVAREVTGFLLAQHIVTTRRQEAARATRSR